MTCSHREAELHTCSSTAPPACSLPSGSPWLLEKESFIQEHLDLCGGNQKQQVMETAGPVGLAVARGFWQSSKWAQWVTLSFPVSLPFCSLFNVILSQPAFIYCPCLPARITSSNRKQMSSSESEVAELCPSHH